MSPHLVGIGAGSGPGSGIGPGGVGGIGSRTGFGGVAGIVITLLHVRVGVPSKPGSAQPAGFSNSGSSVSSGDRLVGRTWCYASLARRITLSLVERIGQRVFGLVGRAAGLGMDRRIAIFVRVRIALLVRQAFGFRFFNRRAPSRSIIGFGFLRISHGKGPCVGSVTNTAAAAMVPGEVLS